MCYYILLIAGDGSTGKSTSGKTKSQKLDPNKKAGTRGQSPLKNKGKKKPDMRLSGQRKSSAAGRRKAVNRNKGSKAKKR